jgi:hypothetical protein
VPATSKYLHLIPPFYQPIMLSRSPRNPGVYRSPLTWSHCRSWVHCPDSESPDSKNLEIPLGPPPVVTLSAATHYCVHWSRALQLNRGFHFHNIARVPRIPLTGRILEIVGQICRIYNQPPFCPIFIILY